MSEQAYSSHTAPIDEYRVLWTTQKKQKLKKWHDGFLRFHKFNKRMLVYDDARHLVADMYLRGQDAIGEGDDLEFEHHLVTIEDFKGTVVQDLTPLFSPAVQRKQQIQAGNALLSSPTPNQANRHGPWGPGRYGTPTPQQRRPMGTTGPPKTPTQPKPIGVPGLTLQQAARQGTNYPAPERFSRPARFPESVTSRAPQGLPSISRQPPQLNLPPGPIQGPRSRPSPGPPAQPERPLPFHATSGQSGPGGRSDRPLPSAPIQRPLTPPPRPHQLPPRSLRLHPNQQPSVTPDLHVGSGLSPDIRLPALPQGPPLSAQPNNAFLRSVSSRLNKYTSGIKDSDFEQFGSLPVHLPTSESIPLSRKNSIALGPAPSSANNQLSAARKSNSETCPFRPPTKRKSTPAVTQQGEDTVLYNKRGKISSKSREGGENEPVFEPLVGTGVLRSNSITSRKRNKLLCQRPLGMAAVRGTTPPTKGCVAKKLRTDSVAEPPPPLEDVMVIGDGGGGSVPTTTRTSTANHRKSGNTSRAFEMDNSRTGVWENDKGKGMANGLSSEQGYRIEEDDTSVP